jgi:hypothetical protein
VPDHPSYLDVKQAIQSEEPISGHWVETVNGHHIGGLAENWRELMQNAAAPDMLSAVELAWIENLARYYILQRAAFVHGIVWNGKGGLLDQVDALDRAASALLRTMSASPAEFELWRRIEEVKENELRRDAVYPIISRLAKLAHELRDQLNAEYKSETWLGQKSAWLSMIYSLASLFHERGWHISASKVSHSPKDTARHSRFAVFVFQFLLCIPADLREHTVSMSQAAVSDAVSDGLSSLKGTSYVGAFRAFAKSICP